MEQLDLVTTSPARLAEIGQLANHYAARCPFTDYQGRLDPSTLARQQDDLAHYCLYLQDAGVSVAALGTATAEQPSGQDESQGPARCRRLDQPGHAATLRGIRRDRQ